MARTEAKNNRKYGSTPDSSAGSVERAGDGRDQYVARVESRIRSAASNIPSAEHEIGSATPAAMNAMNAPGVSAASVEPVREESHEDPFAAFEGDLMGDATTVEGDDPLAEQSTTILQESVEPPYLEVLQGKESGKQFVLSVGDTGIGRGIDNDIILTDIAVSRKHAKIVRDGDALRFRDVGSGNGTLINGEKVFEKTLVDGDRIELGETVLVLRIPHMGMGATSGGRVGSPAMAGARGELGSTPLHRPHADVSAHAAADTRSAASAAYGAHAAQPTVPPSAGPAISGISSVPGASGMPSGWTPSGLTPETSTTSIADSPATTQWIASPESGPALVIPKKMFVSVVTILGALVVLLLVAVGAFVLRGTKSSPVVAVDHESPDADYDQAVLYFEKRNWTEAEKIFGNLLARDQSDTRSMRYLQRIREAREHEARLNSARRALSENDIGKALSEAASIPADSVFSADASELSKHARDRQLAEYVKRARAASEQGRAEEAARYLDDAKLVDPNNPALIALVEELTKGKRPPVRSAAPTSALTAAPTTAPTTAPTSTPTRGPAEGMVDKASVKPNPTRVSENTESAGGATQVTQGAAQPARPAAGADKLVLRLYTNGDFLGASSTARSAASGAAHESDRRRYAQLASDIDKFAGYYGRIRASSDPSSVARQMHSAITLDEQISGGHYAKQLKPTLLEVYLGGARAAWAEGRIPSACQKTRQALAIVPKNPAASAMAERCEKQAADMVRQAVQLEQSDVAKARTMYREVLTMVPQQSGAYTKAYSRLQSMNP
jgi:tetratricopeptide (TPR) repeat protein